MHKYWPQTCFDMFAALSINYILVIQVFDVFILSWVFGSLGTFQNSCETLLTIWHTPKVQSAKSTHSYITHS